MVNHLSQWIALRSGVYETTLPGPDDSIPFLKEFILLSAFVNHVLRRHAKHHHKELQQLVLITCWEQRSLSL